MSENVKELYNLIKDLFNNPWKFNVELESDNSISISLLVKRIASKIDYDSPYIKNFLYRNKDFEVFEDGDREYVKFIG